MQFNDAPLNRYRMPPNVVVSQLDPLSDVLSWLDFMTARDYVVEVHTTHHGIAAASAKSRAKLLIPHVRLAIGYIQQSLQGPERLAFLPAYYAVLNLMKAYILAGPRHADLPAHRHHGVMYDPSKASHSVLTETVSFRKNGALPLFYETITGQLLRPQRLQMGDVYPFIHDVSVEYRMARGQQPRLGYVRISSEVRNGVHRAVARFDSAGHQPQSGAEVRVLVGAKKSGTASNVFQSRPLPLGGRTPEDVLVDQVRWYLLYMPSQHAVGTPVSSRRLLLPEELPIALLFFHMSSVVRYKPEFLERLQQSKYWPMLIVARRHALLRFILLFWSYMHQQVSLFARP